MKNKCKICGGPCKSKYCSVACRKKATNIARREKYRENHPTFENFYVFYDKNDFVRYFGTAQQLVSDGIFPTVNSVHSRVSKIKAGTIVNGSVTVLKCLV